LRHRQPALLLRRPRGGLFRKEGALERKSALAPARPMEQEG
jgi:hypothetical protein